MIKKIMKSMMAVALMLTSIFTIAACSCGNKVKIEFAGYNDEGLAYLQVYVATPDEEGNVSYPNYVGGFNFNGKNSNHKVEKGSFVVLGLNMTSTDYLINDFKLLKDGEAVAPIPKAYLENGLFDEDYIYMVGLVEDTTKITFEGHAKMKQYNLHVEVNDFDTYKNDDRTKDLRYQLMVNGSLLQYDSQTEFTGENVREAFASRVFMITDEVTMRVYYKNKDKLISSDILDDFITATYLANGTGIAGNTDDYVGEVNISYDMHYVSVNYDVFEDVDMSELTDIELQNAREGGLYDYMFEEGNYTYILTIDGSEVERSQLTYGDLYKSSNLKIKFKTTKLVREVIMDEYTMVSPFPISHGDEENAEIVEKNKITYEPITGENYEYLTIDFGNYKSINRYFALYIQRKSISHGDNVFTEKSILEIESLKHALVTASGGYTVYYDNEFQVLEYDESISQTVMLYSQGTDLKVRLYAPFGNTVTHELTITIVTEDDQTLTYIYNDEEYGEYDRLLVDSNYEDVTFSVEYEYFEPTYNYDFVFSHEIGNIKSINFELVGTAIQDN
ncbi:MAG: hypothetical protein IKJ30_00050 [Bacilli bacterium]|nr:hypothetical protein [Bacilli bacterium]